MQEIGRHSPGFRPDQKKRRLRAHHHGGRAERIAALMLILKGYRILAQRYRVAGGEIDLIAVKADAVVFVEVKLRPTISEALRAVDATKRRRMSRAAAVWLTANPWAADKTFRGDLVAMAPWRWPQHDHAAIALDIG
jgi:putative endonuclease